MNSRRSAPIDRGAAGAPVRAAGVVDASAVVAWLRAFAAGVSARRDELTELDAAIGDADHGVNMDRGMQAVAAKLPAAEDTGPQSCPRRTRPPPGRSPSDRSSRTPA